MRLRLKVRKNRNDFFKPTFSSKKRTKNYEKIMSLAHEKLVNILGGHHVGTNIHGWQPYLKIAIYVLKSANGGLLCRPL